MDCPGEIKRFSTKWKCYDLIKCHSPLIVFLSLCGCEKWISHKCWVRQTGRSDLPFSMRIFDFHFFEVVKEFRMLKVYHNNKYALGNDVALKNTQNNNPLHNVSCVFRLLFVCWEPSGFCTRIQCRCEWIERIFFVPKQHFK